MKKNRDVSIDIMKIIASFAVVCLHVIEAPASNTENWVYYLSGCAIPLLLMVNGYLLLNKEKITFKRQNIKTLKMLGVVFAWCLTFSIIYFLNSKGWYNPLTTMFEGLFMQKGLLAQFWFMGALILLHLFLPLIHKMFQKQKLSVVVTLMFIAVSFSSDLINVLFVALDRPLIQSYVPQAFRLWTYFSYFLLGGILGKVKIKEMIKIKIKPWVHLLIIVVLSVVIVNYQVYTGANYYGTTYAEFFYDSIFIMTWNIALFSFINRLVIENKQLVKFVAYISVNTFTVYALHIYLLEILRKFVDYRIIDFMFWVPLLVFVVGQIISIVLRTNKFTRVLVTF